MVKYFKQISYNFSIKLICHKITQVIPEGMLRFSINTGINRGCNSLITIRK